MSLEARIKFTQEKGTEAEYKPGEVVGELLYRGGRMLDEMREEADGFKIPAEVWKR